MKLETTVKVTHIDVTKTVTGGTKLGIVTMNLGDGNLVNQGNGNFSVEQPFNYADSDGNMLPYSDKYRSGVFKISGEELKAASTAVGFGESVWLGEAYLHQVKMFAITEFASTFGITPAKIKEI